ncbi:hypothetical protein SNR37_000990, partial [Agarivorans aestuarii]
ANKASGLTNPDLALRRFSALRAVSVEVHYRDARFRCKRFLKKITETRSSVQIVNNTTLKE